jgi:hypothetical protein
MEPLNSCKDVCFVGFNMYLNGTADKNLHPMLLSYVYVLAGFLGCEMFF